MAYTEGYDSFGFMDDEDIDLEEDEDDSRDGYDSYGRDAVGHLTEKYQCSYLDSVSG